MPPPPPPPPPPPQPSPHHRSSTLRQNYAPNHTLLVYTRPLHPELFQMKARKTLAVRGAEFEAWLTPMGHMLRYQSKTHCICELVSERDAGLPTSGVAAQFQAVGEKDHEQLFAEAYILYNTSIQTENLSEALYNTGLREMRELAQETSAMISEWTIPDVGRCLSMLEVQRFEDEVHAQSTHMHPIEGLVLRTQTVFQRV